MNTETDRRLNELSQELESLYAEHNDLIKKQNLLYEKLKEAEKKNEKRKCNSRSN